MTRRLPAPSHRTRRIALRRAGVGGAFEAASATSAVEAPPPARRVSAFDWDEFVAGHRAGLIEWNTARLSPGRGGQGSARRRRELDLPLSRIVEARENILAGFLALLPPLAVRR